MNPELELPVFQTIILNIGGKFRREELEGRPHLVVPAVILKESVLNGSKGPIFYPAEEIEAGKT